MLKNNCCYTTPTATARRTCTPCEPKKPKGAFAPCDDFEEDFLVRRRRKNKKKRPHQVRLERDPYNAQDRRHRTSHGYRLAARDTAQLLASDSVDREMEDLREENEYLRFLLDILDDCLDAGQEWCHLQDEHISCLQSELEMAEAEAAYWHSQVEEYRGNADYWYHKYSALRAEIEDEA